MFILNGEIKTIFFIKIFNESEIIFNSGVLIILLS